MDWSLLPQELLRLVYDWRHWANLSLTRWNPPPGEHPATGSDVSWLRDRLRGLGVCTQWRAALEDWPIAHLELGQHTKPCSMETLVQWLVCKQPRVMHLDLLYHPRLDVTLLSSLLHSLPRQDLHVLKYLARLGCLPHALPHPAALRSLRDLRVNCGQCDPGWLLQLGELPHLQDLVLHDVIASDEHHMALTLPCMPHLLTLKLTPGEGTTVRIAPADLPSLTDLDLPYAAGRVEVASPHKRRRRQQQQPPSPSRVTLLILRCNDAAVDFSALPQLRSAMVWSTGLQGGQTLAAATALTDLCLSDLEGVDEALEAWATELLSSAPPSLRSLTVCGDWTREHAALIGGMGQLTCLKLESFDEPPPLPERCAVWRGLRGLKFCSDMDSVDMPAGLRHATQLETLQLGVGEVTPADIDLLASLPALRHLWLGVHGEAATAAVKQAMPGLQTLRTQGMGYYDFDDHFL